MRKLRQLSMTVVLILTFAICGFAGIMPTVPGPESAPVPPSTTGTIETPPQSESADPFEIVLGILQSVLF